VISTAVAVAVGGALIYVAGVLLRLVFAKRPESKP